MKDHILQPFKTVKITGLLYFYVFRRQTGRQKFPNWTLASIHTCTNTWHCVPINKAHSAWSLQAAFRAWYGMALCCLSRHLKWKRFSSLSLTKLRQNNTAISTIHKLLIYGGIHYKIVT
jgi:hypothetical protein